VSQRGGGTGRIDRNPSAAILAAAPALDPPDVFSRFQGLRVIPVKGLSLDGLQPNSVVVVLPRIQAPAALRRSTAGASALAMLFSIVLEPKACFTPPIAMRSFTDIGTP